jgi:hypothetical protein
MSKRRPDHYDDMTERSDPRRIRARRRRRRLVRGVVRIVIWAVLLTGVFVLGIGYGKTIASDEKVSTKRVTITQERGEVEVTLPTKTVTVTKTVKVVKRANRGQRSGANR